MRSRRLLVVSLVVVVALSLAACATPTVNDGRMQVVASTNVYGDIARMIGGGKVDVTSIISDPSQDPHSFEANAHVQLALSKATVIIENGGGYDDWVGTLLRGANNPGAVVLNATTISGYDAGVGFNEHLWYDFPTVRKVVEQLVAALSQQAPASATEFRSNADSFEKSLADLESREVAIKASSRGTGVAITEPVPLYLLTAVGLTNVTPAAFSAAVEAGTGVSPLVLAQTLALFTDHTAKLLVYNAQSSGPETKHVLAAATQAGVPVVAVTETLPAGKDYLGWMSANIDAIAAALA